MTHRIDAVCEAARRLLHGCEQLDLRALETELCDVLDVMSRPELHALYARPDVLKALAADLLPPGGAFGIVVLPASEDLFEILVAVATLPGLWCVDVMLASGKSWDLIDAIALQRDDGNEAPISTLLVTCNAAAHGVVLAPVGMIVASSDGALVPGVEVRQLGLDGLPCDFVLGPRCRRPDHLAA